MTHWKGIIIAKKKLIEGRKTEGQREIERKRKREKIFEIKLNIVNFLT